MVYSPSAEVAISDCRLSQRHDMRCGFCSREKSLHMVEPLSGSGILYGILLAKSRGSTTFVITAVRS